MLAIFRNTSLLSETAVDPGGLGRLSVLAANDPKIFQKINGLIKDIERSPFRGLGKPEALKYALTGWWSRRITDEHRLVYRVSGKAQRVLEIAQCRYHY